MLPMGQNVYLPRSIQVDREVLNKFYLRDAILICSRILMSKKSNQFVTQFQV